MNDSQWEQFFDFVNRIVGDPERKSWGEKRANLIAKAEQFSCETNLEELAAWVCDG